MGKNLSLCLGRANNGQYQSAYRLLMLVPHEKIHCTMGIIEKLYMLLPRNTNEGNNKRNAELAVDFVQGDSLNGTSSASEEETITEHRAHIPIVIGQHWSNKSHHLKGNAFLPSFNVYSYSGDEWLTGLSDLCCAPQRYNPKDPSTAFKLQLKPSDSSTFHLQQLYLALHLTHLTHLHCPLPTTSLIALSVAACRARRNFASLRTKLRVSSASVASLPA